MFLGSVNRYTMHAIHVHIHVKPIIGPIKLWLQLVSYGMPFGICLLSSCSSLIGQINNSLRCSNTVMLSIPIACTCTHVQFMLYL